jgi:glucose/arabinose dehydrogenase
VFVRRLLLAGIPLAVACSLSPRLASSVPPSVSPPTSVPAPTGTPSPLQPTPTPGPTLPPIPTAFPDPAAYHWTLFAEGFRSPVDLQNAGGEALYVVEQAGVIRRVSAAGQDEGVFLDIRGRVGSSANEQGLLGLAFPPNHGETGEFFVNYTNLAGDTVIARFRQSGETADPGSESLVLAYDQPYPNHNGGGIAFGPDGYLYLGSGDGGSAGDPQQRAQNLGTLLGKILRLDVDAQPYAVPPDNPFAAGGGRSEIWAFGLRNPWRFAFDPATGDLFIADVGQNHWEEINHLPAGSAGGANFGWDFREGYDSYEGSAPSGLIDPVAVYSHAEGCSVTGGVVVRDPALPEWSGIYLYGDFCSGRIWGLFRDAAGDWQNRLLFETRMKLTSFGAGADGRVYAVDRGGGIYRLAKR